MSDIVLVARRDLRTAVSSMRYGETRDKLADAVLGASPSVWIVATENAEYLPDAWVFSTHEAAIEWLAQQVMPYIAEHGLLERHDYLSVLESTTATVDEKWEKIRDAQDFYDMPIAFALWERVIDGGGELPL